jgi:5-enolpyruvylshikimate-3-phosphate synthase
VEDADAVTVSFPGFFEMLEELRRTSTVAEDDRR